MIRTYLRNFGPLLRSFGNAATGQQQNVLSSNNGRLLRRNLTLPSQPCSSRQAVLRISGVSRAIRDLPARPRTSGTVQRSLRSPVRTNRRSFHNSSRKRSANPDPTKPKAPEKPQGLSARLKKLSREYGWSAVGVYFALSVLDFPFCFLLVRVVGTDRIGELEHWVVSHATNMIPHSVRDRWNEYRQALKQAEREHLGNDEISEHVEMATWGVAEAEERHNAEASLGTQLALAYAIHKSFIFLRVPLTAAVTPKVVKVLRSWGWNIGKRRPKP
ncbi:peptide alpha-N-acetyltransferase Nat2 [Xylariaceae sp. FL1019]|nr:peptide alpha-N-acetyltransferase Nat2 [Xylariaceae sp. FL1019]